MVSHNNTLTILEFNYHCFSWKGIVPYFHVLYFLLTILRRLLLCGRMLWRGKKAGASFTNTGQLKVGMDK